MAERIEKFSQELSEPTFDRNDMNRRSFNEIDNGQYSKVRRNSTFIRHLFFLVEFFIETDFRTKLKNSLLRPGQNENGNSAVRYVETLF